MNTYKQLTIALIAIWFIAVLSASAFGLFENDSDQAGLAVAVAAAAPVAAFFAWFTMSRAFRRFVLSLNPRILTIAHSWRIMGLAFVLLAANGVLPRVFALPAGYGDIAIGATAAWAALKLANPSRRYSFIVWQALGMADLAIAVTLGTTARLLSTEGSMQVMTVLPLSLVPAFLVPLFLIFHAISIAQARTWTSPSRWAVAAL
jgi:hypothetical protein